MLIFMELIVEKYFALCWICRKNKIKAVFPSINHLFYKRNPFFIYAFYQFELPRDWFKLLLWGWMTCFGWSWLGVKSLELGPVMQLRYIMGDLRLGCRKDILELFLSLRTVHCGCCKYLHELEVAKATVLLMKKKPLLLWVPEWLFFL